MSLMSRFRAAFTFHFPIVDEERFQSRNSQLLEAVLVVPGFWLGQVYFVRKDHAVEVSDSRKLKGATMSPGILDSKAVRKPLASVASSHGSITGIVLLHISTSQSRRSEI
jgi:hypothetical protein